MVASRLVARFGLVQCIDGGWYVYVSQVPNPCGLVAAQQAGAVSQLVPLPTAQQLPTAAPPVPQLSVQTSLQLQTSSLQPDISAQLHAVSHTATALPDTSVCWFHPFLLVGCASFLEAWLQKVAHCATSADHVQCWLQPCRLIFLSYHKLSSGFTEDKAMRQIWSVCRLGA